tara:strand:- start:43 stop:327 length:285 start_codon:yes stop_codon:yes gene_type:complete
MFTSEKQKLQNLNLKEWLQEKKTINEKKKAQFIGTLDTILNEEHEVRTPDYCSECNNCYDTDWEDFESAIYIIRKSVSENRYNIFKNKIKIETV